MKTQAIVAFVYGVLLLLGGVMGYAKAGSLPSLIAGVLFSGLLAASGFGILAGRAFGLPLALGSTGILIVFFGYRFFQTGSMMPAGGMFIISLLVLIAFLALRSR
jgi:uncharacterized membrane protein (UPF0136 family)